MQNHLQNLKHNMAVDHMYGLHVNMWINKCQAHKIPNSNWKIEGMRKKRRAKRKTRNCFAWLITRWSIQYCRSQQWPYIYINQVKTMGRKKCKCEPIESYKYADFSVCTGNFFFIEISVKRNNITLFDFLWIFLSHFHLNEKLLVDNWHGLIDKIHNRINGFGNHKLIKFKVNQ